MCLICSSCTAQPLHCQTSQTAGSGKVGANWSAPMQGVWLPAAMQVDSGCTGFTIVVTARRLVCEDAIGIGAEGSTRRDPRSTICLTEAIGCEVQRQARGCDDTWLPIARLSCLWRVQLIAQIVGDLPAGTRQPSANKLQDQL